MTFFAFAEFAGKWKTEIAFYDETLAPDYCTNPTGLRPGGPKHRDPAPSSPVRRNEIKVGINISDVTQRLTRFQKFQSYPLETTRMSTELKLSKKQNFITYTQCIPCYSLCNWKDQLCSEDATQELRNLVIRLFHGNPSPCLPILSIQK